MTFFASRKRIWPSRAAYNEIVLFLENYEINTWLSWQLISIDICHYCFLWPSGEINEKSLDNICNFQIIEGFYCK